MSPDDSRRALRHQAKAALHQLLGQALQPLTRPLSVAVRDRTHEATLIVGPLDRTRADAAEAFPGLFFSPVEAAIFHALTRPMFGKEIARALGRRYDAELKFILVNLVRRKVLLHERGKGYSRAPTLENRGHAPG